MKYNVDIKSVIIGFLSAALLISTVSFKNNGDEKDGRYKAVLGKQEIIMIDTQTGAYIMSTYITRKMNWIKGDFNNTYKVSKSDLPK